MAIVPTHSNGHQRQPSCQAKKTYDEFKGLFRGQSLRPVCPALQKILRERGKGSGPAVLGAAVTLADRMRSVLNACICLTNCPPVLEVVALWAHGGNLHAGVAPVVDDLAVLAKQLQRDYPLSARKLEDLSQELDLATATYEMVKASGGYVYLEPDEFARDHWQSFRLWRNQQLEAAELGGGRPGRIQMARLTSTYPVDVVSVASDIIEELAPIARDIADKVPKPAAEQASVKDRFTFDQGQALFDGRDLELPTGFTIEVLKKLVTGFARTVPYGTLDENSQKTADEQLRKAKQTIARRLKEHRVPCAIVPKPREGYCLCEGTAQKRTRKTHISQRQATQKKRHK